MAGDWIPMRVDLHDDPAVIATAARLTVTENEVVGALLKCWGWANRQSRSGHVCGVTPKWLDRHVGLDGFAASLQSVGWLDWDDDGIKVPKWDNWLSQTAKDRVLAAKRQKAKRHGSVTAPSRANRDPSVTTVQDSTSRVDDVNSAPKQTRKRKEPDIEFAAVKSRWNELAEIYHLPPIQEVSRKRQAAFRAALKACPDLWVTLAREFATRNAWARENRFPSFDQAIRPAILQRLLEGTYRAPGEAAKPEPTEEDKARHARAVAELLKRVGQYAVDSDGFEYVPEASALHGPQGYRPWEAYKAEVLESLLNEKVFRWVPIPAQGSTDDQAEG